MLFLRFQYAGIHVDIHITEGSHVITFSEFVHGQAAVHVVNHTPDCVMEISERGTDKNK